MTAETILRDMTARGITLIPNGNMLDVDAPDALLTDDVVQTLRAHKAELLAILKRADGDPFVTVENCTVCGSELLSDQGKRFRKVWCPAGCKSGWRPPHNNPHIDENGDLIIPLDAEARYRWWQGGQSVAETLRELAERQAAEWEGEAGQWIN